MPISTGIVVTPRRYLPVSVVNLGLAATNVLFPPMTLGGQPINSPFTDANGIGWIVNQFDGWDAPELTVTDTPRGNTDGTFHEPGYYRARLIIARGAFISIAGPQALMAARELLHAAVSITGNSLAPFVVNESPPKMCMVQQAPGYKDRAAGTSAFEFEIHLKANDPFKYDPVSSSVVLAVGASATLTNLGTRGSAPIVTVNGPCSNLNIANNTTGQFLAFSITLGASDVMVINLDRRSATRNGVDVKATVVSTPSQWWKLQPGANTITFNAVGTGTATVSYSSAWI